MWSLSGLAPKRSSASERQNRGNRGRVFRGLPVRPWLGGGPGGAVACRYPGPRRRLLAGQESPGGRIAGYLNTLSLERLRRRKIRSAGLSPGCLETRNLEIRKFARFKEQAMQSGFPVEEKYMRRAFQLASYGLGSASPNPVVGCVIVYQDSIIGEGFHHQCGQPHAEVNAINAVLQPNAVTRRLMLRSGLSAEQILQDSTLYVSLEPCSHYGKTPPCASLIIRSGIPRVVVSCPDPNPKVDGRGIALLKEAGVQVREHFLEEEGRELGRRYFANVEKRRPYVILKWARTADGCIAAVQGEPCAITGPLLQALNHSYRTQEDAILVGTGTLLSDNPRLNARCRVLGKRVCALERPRENRSGRGGNLARRPDSGHAGFLASGENRIVDCGRGNGLAIVLYPARVLGRGPGLHIAFGVRFGLPCPILGKCSGCEDEGFCRGMGACVQTFARMSRFPYPGLFFYGSSFTLPLLFYRDWSWQKQRKLPSFWREFFCLQKE